MRQGKFSNDRLNALVLSKLKAERGDILLHPGVGEDCCAIRVGGEVCVLSTDPITAADADAGALAVHVTANDIASSGAAPVAMLVTLLAPPSATENDICRAVDQLIETADELGIEIVGGHTEVTDAVNRIVLSTTALGKLPQSALVRTSGAQADDTLIMTKTAGIEGTLIIAADRRAAVADILTEGDNRELRAMKRSISVVKEGLIAGGCGVHSMHDVTEGGILGAIHELCQASSVGAEVELDAIPVAEVTKKLCAEFSIDPLRLIGSGSMLMAADDPRRLLAALADAAVSATVIGRLTAGGIMGKRGNVAAEIAPPDADELYKTVQQEH